MSVLILAAGEHKRWPEETLGYPKHLAYVGKETVLHRTIRQVKERNCHPVVVTKWRKISMRLGHRVGRTKAFLPKRYWCTIDTFLSTKVKGLWNDERTIVLLGDVVWTDDAISNILADDTPTVRFHGNLHEMFGFTFAKCMNEHLANVAAGVIESAKASDDPNNGKLWQLYRAHCGIPRDVHRIESNCFHKVEDWTTDIDTWEDYQQLLKEHFHVIHP